MQGGWWRRKPPCIVHRCRFVHIFFAEEEGDGVESSLPLEKFSTLNGSLKVFCIVPRNSTTSIRIYCSVYTVWSAPSSEEYMYETTTMRYAGVGGAEN